MFVFNYSFIAKVSITIATVNRHQTLSIGTHKLTERIKTNVIPRTQDCIHQILWSF